MLSPLATRLLAYVVLAAAALLPLGWLAVQFRRSRLTISQTVLYGLCVLLTRLQWRARVIGSLDLPPGQGAVIVSNHRSSIDPLFIAIAAKCVVHWMVAKEYCAQPAFRWFLRSCEVIPTSRAGIDTAATKAAIRLAREGGLVGVFPEGRVNTSKEFMLSSRPGVAMIALKAQVPVIPCYISGSPYDGTAGGALLMTARVKLRLGRPIDLSPYYGRENERQVLEDLTKGILSTIAAMAGQSDFQPQIAGRFYRPEE
jgi:1-acyl-sn-glycerol-3-phosphate acyltransferase